MTNQTDIAPEDILGIQVAPQEIARGQVNTCLRYVVGAFAHPYGSNASSFGKEGTEEKLEAWQDAAAKYLGSQYHCTAEVCTPDTLYEALKDGWFWSHMTSLASQLAEVLRHYRLLPGEITTVISLHAFEDSVYQLHIGYSQLDETGKPKLLGGSIWPMAPFEDPNEVTDSIKQTLENNGIAAVEVVSKVQAGFNGKDGAPFLLPPRRNAPDLTGHMPTPTHLQ